MIKTTHTRYSLIALLLVLALLFPSLVQAGHLFEDHDHKPCKDLSTHLHEKQLDCSLYDFHLASFDMPVLGIPDYTATPLFLKKNLNPETTYIFRISYGFLLRGPPAHF